jgi:predicted amidohydrolase YtcJ
VVLNGNYMQVPENELDTLDIDLTFVAGKLAYDASRWQE